MPSNVLLIGLQASLRDGLELIVEESAFGEGMEELVEAVVIQTFFACVAQRCGQLVEWAHLGACKFIAQRIDAELADEPLVQEQLVAEIVLLGLDPGFPRSLRSSHVGLAIPGFAYRSRIRDKNWSRS